MDGFIHPSWLADVSGGQNPTNKFIAETASNNLKGDFQHTEFHQKSPPAPPNPTIIHVYLMFIY